MQETLEYIDDYFTQALDSEQKKAFELRCGQDAAFAKEVAFYLSARNAARELLVEQKQQAAPENIITAKEPVKIAPANKRTIRLWLPYAAAACILFIIATTFLSNSSTPERLAFNYINHTFDTLYQQMDATKDSMKVGIEAYNAKDYERALMLFNGVRQIDTANSDADTYAGLAYYHTKNYDKALQCFDELAAAKGLHNMGDFLKAAALLQRSKPGDKEQAKLLLQKVDIEGEDGSEEAHQMLEKWK